MVTDPTAQRRSNFGSNSNNNTLSSSCSCPSQSQDPGRHLASRLVQIGITDVFSVPRDFNLALLDHLVAEPGLTNISCYNELNAGYAADGHGRSRGVCACVVARSCM